MTKETKGARTRRYLDDCANQLFRARGYDQVSVDEIVRKAGMAKGTFYIYFRAKSDIILEMLRQYDDYYDQVMAGLPDSLPVDGRLEEIVRAACRFTEQVIGLDLIRVLYSKQLTAGARNPGLLNEDRALFRILSGLIAEGQRAGVYRAEQDVSAVALLLLHGIRAAFFEWCCGSSRDLTGECLRFLTLVRQGIYQDKN